MWEAVAEEAVAVETEVAVPVVAALALAVAEPAELVVWELAAQSARFHRSRAPTGRKRMPARVLPAPTKKYKLCLIATKRRSTGCTTGSFAITQR